MITERIEKRQKEKEELRAQLAIEMNKQVRLSATDNQGVPLCAQIRR